MKEIGNIICKHCQAENKIYEEELKSNWIDLDIDNLPERFFTRDDIEIETKDNEGGKWRAERQEREYSVFTRRKFPHIEYRYRIQEKKPIQITEDLKQFIVSAIDNGRDGDLKTWCDRQVIIID